MKVLRTLKFLLSFIGLNTNSTSPVYKMYRWTWLFFIVHLIVPMTLFCFKDSTTDVHIISELVLHNLSETATALKFLLYLYNRKTFAHLFEEIRQVANERSKYARDEYAKAERHSRIVASMYIGLVIGTIIPFMLQSAVVALFLGTNIQWKIPYELIYFLDINKTFGFLLAYIMSCISTFTVGMTVATMDSLYVGLTVYIAAMFQDLQLSISELENKFRQTEIGTESPLLFGRKKLLKKFRIELIHSIRFHTRILRCLENMQKCFGSVIFVQFQISSLILCVVAFQISLSANGAQILKYVTFILTLSVELFIYAWYGTKVIEEGKLIADSVAQTLWYRHKADTRYIYRFMMMRAQRTRYFSGFGFFDCNLENFTEVLKLASSIFTVLQSVTE